MEFERFAHLNDYRGGTLEVQGQIFSNRALQAVISLADLSCKLAVKKEE
jgi:hypothetical protein